MASWDNPGQDDTPERGWHRDRAGAGGISARGLTEDRFD